MAHVRISIQVGAARSNFGDERYENPEMQAEAEGETVFPKVSI